MRISKLAGLACGVAFILAQRAALADIAIDDDGVTVNFTDFTAAGFSASPSAGQLSSNDWSISGFSDGDLNFGSNNTAPDYKRGVAAAMLGTLNEGGIYAFSSAANPMFGILQSAEDFTPGTLTARFKSSVAHPIVKLAVSYKILTYNKGTRADSLNFSWSLDNATYTAIASLDYTSPAAAAGSPAWETTNRTTQLTVNIPQNGHLYLRWSGNDGGGTGTTYDLLGLDDISVTPQNGCGDGVAAGGEYCDDGNQSNADFCLSTCVQASCGDGYLRTSGTQPEQCDSGIQGTQCCSSCLKTTGNACTAAGNRSGTCNAGTCVANPSQGSGGEGGETSASGAGGETNGGETNGGETSTGGTGNRGGRGPRAGSGGTAPGEAGMGTAGTGTAGTGMAGTGTAGTTAEGGTSGGGAPSGGKSGSGGSGGSAGTTGGTSGGKAGAGGTGSTTPPASGGDDDGGCGCSVPRSSNHASLALVMLGALAAFARRRRRS